VGEHLGTHVSAVVYYHTGGGGKHLDIHVLAVVRCHTGGAGEHLGTHALSVAHHHICVSYGVLATVYLHAFVHQAAWEFAYL